VGWDRKCNGTHATGALEIQVLLPLIMNPPSTSSAVVSIPAGSEPWFGSVSPYWVFKAEMRDRCNDHR